MKKIFYSIIACIAICINASAQIGYQVSLLNTATGEPRANVSVNATVKITDSQDGTIYSGTQRVTSNDFGVLSLTVGDENTFANVDWGKLPLFIEVQVDGATIGKSQILSVPVAEYAKKTGELTKEKLIGTWVYDVTGYYYENWSYRIKTENGYQDITYTYKQYGSKKHRIQFLENGTFTFSHDENKSWREGHLDADGIPDDERFTSNYEPKIVTGEYFIDGNEVRLVGGTTTGVYDEIVNSHTNTPVSYSFFYVPEKNVLGHNEYGTLVKQ